MDLTKPELLAKNHFTNLITKGNDVPIGPVNSFTFDFEKPSWFNETKYNLGREYFRQNEVGVVSSVIIGLIWAMALPKAIAILKVTNKTLDKESARKRYALNVVHVLKWYEMELTKESGSWESLKKVRRIHLYASNGAVKRNIGFISQMEMVMTTYGFAGFVINRPHLFGINNDNKKLREGFVHFWAVIHSMLGIEDRFNIFLLPIEAVEIEFDIIMRNIYGPLLQFEPRLFKKMAQTFVDAFSDMVPVLDYESLLFITRRASGIPGYQYRLDLKKEIPHRNIFSPNEVQILRKYFPMFSDKIPIIIRKKLSNPMKQCLNIEDEPFDLDIENLTPEFMLQSSEMGCNTNLIIKEVPRGPKILPFLNAKKYDSLSPLAKRNADIFILLSNLITNRMMQGIGNDFLNIMKPFLIELSMK